MSKTILTTQQLHQAQLMGVTALVEKLMAVIVHAHGTPEMVRALAESATQRIDRVALRDTAPAVAEAWRDAARQHIHAMCATAQLTTKGSVRPTRRD